MTSDWDILECLLADLMSRYRSIGMGNERMALVFMVE